MHECNCIDNVSDFPLSNYFNWLWSTYPMKKEDISTSKCMCLSLISLFNFNAVLMLHLTRCSALTGPVIHPRWLQLSLQGIGDARVNKTIVIQNSPYLAQLAQIPFITQNPRPQQIRKSIIPFTQPHSSGWLAANRTLWSSGAEGEKNKKKHDPSAAMDASYQAECVLSAGWNMAAPR